MHDTSLASVRAITGNVTRPWPATRRLALAVGLLGLVACGEGPEPASQLQAPPVTSVYVTPDPATVLVGQTVQLTATPRDAAGNALSGRVVSWGSSNTGVATVDNTGLVSGVAAGSATITATSEGQSGTSALTVTPPFPTEYSLTRPLLVNNPGALVTGEDWQDMNSTQDVLDLPGRGGKLFFHIGGQDISASGYATLTTDDPTFTKVVKCLQGDGSDALHPGTTSAKRDFAGISKAWYRFTMKFQPGFTNDGPGSGAKSWKVMFGGAQRNYEFLGNGPIFDYVNMDATRPGYGGTESRLPNGESSHGQASTEWTDGEWWEFIVYEERVSSTHYRVRKWRRELTTNGVITGPTSSATWARLFGSEVTGASVPVNDSNTIRLGINRNRFMFPGKQQHWFWGPWEVIDGSVLPDPYGIENQIR